MKKAIYKIQGKDTQYQHELRKKDAMLKRFQEQIEKIQNDKKKLYYNNAFEFSQPLEMNGPNLFSSSVALYVFLSQRSKYRVTPNLLK